MSDVRVLKTKENIHNAFFVLLEKDRYHQLTVDQICRESRCSRSTFYMYYENKEGLLSEIIDEQVSIFEKYVEERFTYKGNFPDILRKIIEEIIIPNQFQLNLLFNIRDTEKNLPDELKKLYTVLFKKQYPHIPSMEIISDIYTSSVLTILHAALHNKIDASDIRNIAEIENIVSKNFLDK